MYPRQLEDLKCTEEPYKEFSQRDPLDSSSKFKKLFCNNH